jgi:molybdopterin guanine dinucleotide-containing S/N-oxide reductase-like protein
MGDETVVYKHCSGHNCGSCILKVYVKDGVITKIGTDDGDDPQLRACARGRSYRQMIYSPERLKYPMKRTGERGEGLFQRISWEEALDTVASQIKRVRSTYGPAALLYVYSVGSTWTKLHTAGLLENVLNRTGGFSGTWGGASAQAGVFSDMMTYGEVSYSNSRDDLLNSRLIIMWGWNPAISSTYGNTGYYLSQAKEAGTPIIAVDPRYTDSAAAYADQWIYIRPGTDTAMMVAMAYVMMTENLQAQAFLDKYTVGYDHFKGYVLGTQDGTPKTPGWAEAITGVPRGTIIQLARAYARTKPAALMAGVAPGRTAFGEQYHRASTTLAAMTGNIGVRGGHAPGAGILTIFPNPLKMGPMVSDRMEEGRVNPVDLHFPPRRNAYWYNKLPHAMWYFGGPSSARVNRFRLADAILKGRDGGYPVDYKMAFFSHMNYLNQGPNSNKTAEALKKLDFVVVAEQFITATAKFADILLPENTDFERNDVSDGGMSLLYGYQSKIIESFGEARSTFEVANELAMRLGISDWTKTEEEWLREVVEGCEDIPGYEEFKQRGYHKVKLSEPFIGFAEKISDPENYPFATPSGKIEIYSQEIADVGDPLLPPIPTYIEAWESQNDPLTRKFPLQLVTTQSKMRGLSRFETVPWLRELEPHAVLINTMDARDRRISDGEMVRVFNDRGQMVIQAKVSPRIMPGVVDVPEGAWYAPDEDGVDMRGCANVLTKDAMSPAGAFCSNSALVQVEKRGVLR